MDVENRKGDILGAVSVADQEKDFMILNANGTFSKEIEVENVNQIFDKHGMDLNGHIRVVIKDLDGKTYRFSKDWPVG